MNNEQSAEAILKERLSIAEIVSREYARTHPEFAARWGEAGLKRCSEDAAYHLAYLAEAIRFDAPELFLDYLTWAKVLLNALKLPANDFVENLRLLQSITAKVVPPELFAPAEPFFTSAINAVPNLPTQLETFLKPDNPQYQLAKSWLDNLLAHRTREARLVILDAVKRGTRVPDIYEHVFVPALQEVGRLWQQRNISEAEEHYCTHVTQNLLAMLSATITAARTRKSIVGFAVEGEHHEIGIRLAMDCFALHGWDTVCLGVNVPTRNVQAILRNWKPDLVALSATMTFNLPQVRAVIKEIDTHCGSSRPRIVVGGRPFGVCRSLVEKVGADATGNICSEAVACLGL